MPPAGAVVAPRAPGAPGGPLPECPSWPLPAGGPGLDAPRTGWTGAPRRGSPLGNKATNVSGGADTGATAQRKRDRRRYYRSLRYRLRHAGQAVARSNSNVSKCGRVRVYAHGVELCRRQDGTAYYRGVVHCASVWECAVCSARVTMQRAWELRFHVGAYRHAGAGSYLLSLTTPHDQGDDLKHLRQTVANAWRFVCSGRAWLRWKERIGYVGSVRSAEATVGLNGWHPHLHILIFTAAPLTEELRQEFEDFVYERWCRKIEACGYRKPSREHGVVLTESHKDDYLAKMNLADEVASGAFKDAKEGRRSPLAVLHDYEQHHRPRDLALWKEWCECMRGAKMLTWSKGVRERYTTEREVSDTEVVETEEKRVPAEVVALIEPEMWDEGVSHRPDLQTRLLNAAEEYGERGVWWILAKEPYPGVPF